MSALPNTFPTTYKISSQKDSCLLEVITLLFKLTLRASFICWFLRLKMKGLIRGVTTVLRRATALLQETW